MPLINETPILCKIIMIEYSMVTFGDSILSKILMIESSMVNLCDWKWRW